MVGGVQGLPSCVGPPASLGPAAVAKPCSSSAATTLQPASEEEEWGDWRPNSPGRGPLDVSIPDADRAAAAASATCPSGTAASSLGASPGPAALPLGGRYHRLHPEAALPLPAATAQPVRQKLSWLAFPQAGSPASARPAALGPAGEKRRALPQPAPDIVRRVARKAAAARVTAAEATAAGRDERLGEAPDRQAMRDQLAAVSVKVPGPPPLRPASNRPLGLYQDPDTRAMIMVPRNPAARIPRPQLRPRLPRCRWELL